MPAQHAGDRTCGSWSSRPRGTALTSVCSSRLAAWMRCPADHVRACARICSCGHTEPGRSRWAGRRGFHGMVVGRRSRRSGIVCRICRRRRYGRLRGNCALCGRRRGTGASWGPLGGEDDVPAAPFTLDADRLDPTSHRPGLSTGRCPTPCRRTRVTGPCGVKSRASRRRPWGSQRVERLLERKRGYPDFSPALMRRKTRPRPVRTPGLVT